MSLGAVYAIVLIVSVGCGFLGRKRPNKRLNVLAGVVMLAACFYATVYFTWFHVLGFVGITLLGLNLFGAIEMLQESRNVRKEQEDKLFRIDDDEEEDK